MCTVGPAKSLEQFPKNSISLHIVLSHWTEQAQALSRWPDSTRIWASAVVMYKGCHGCQQSPVWTPPYSPGSCVCSLAHLQCGLAGCFKTVAVTTRKAAANKRLEGGKGYVSVWGEWVYTFWVRSEEGKVRHGGWRVYDGGNTGVLKRGSPQYAGRAAG